MQVARLKSKKGVAIISHLFPLICTTKVASKGVKRADFMLQNPCNNMGKYNKHINNFSHFLGFNITSLGIYFYSEFLYILLMENGANFEIHNTPTRSVGPGKQKGRKRGEKDIPYITH